MTSPCERGWSLERGLARSLLVLLSRLEGSLIGFATTGWKDDFPRWKGEGGTLNMTLKNCFTGFHHWFSLKSSGVQIAIARHLRNRSTIIKKDWKKRKKGQILNVTQTQCTGSGRHRVTTFPKVSASGIQRSSSSYLSSAKSNNVDK
jgi:hypothetical protein